MQSRGSRLVALANLTETRFGALNLDLTQSDRTFFVKLSFAWVV